SSLPPAAVAALQAAVTGHRTSGQLHAAPRPRERCEDSAPAPVDPVAGTTWLIQRVAVASLAEELLEGLHQLLPFGFAAQHRVVPPLEWLPSVHACSRRTLRVLCGSALRSDAQGMKSGNRNLVPSPPGERSGSGVLSYPNHRCAFVRSTPINSGPRRE